jgi:hypothetical protein
MDKTLEITIRAPAFWRIINYIYNNIDRDTQRMYNNFKEYLNIDFENIPIEFPVNDMIIMNDFILTIMKIYILCPNLYSKLNLIFNDKIFNLIISDDRDSNRYLIRIQELQRLNKDIYNLLKKIKYFRTNNEINNKLKTYSKLVEIYDFDNDFSIESKFLLFTVKV